MCGIIGIVGKQEASPFILDGLKRLEYRGYDSAGIATLSDGKIHRLRAEGKIVNLEARLNKSPLQGRSGIGHTRWATHGIPNETNAHPHAKDRVAVVHNGIIENFSELREELENMGHVFESETDTEVIVHLLDQYLGEGDTPEKAASKTLKRLTGAFALAILFKDHPDYLISARRGSPLAIGYGDGEMFVGSDALALAPLTQKICYLQEGDWAILTPESVNIFDEQDQPVEREVQKTAFSGALIGKGEHRHFMLKEIYEQPSVIGDTLHAYVNSVMKSISLPPLPCSVQDLSRVTLVACGTSYYAAMVAKYWIEQLAQIPVEVDIASEFRYRESPLPKNGLAVFISQSGETADTLAALNYAKAEAQGIVSIVNVPESSIARQSDLVLETHAGPEIGVASTKAFTAQLATLACLAISLAKERGCLLVEKEQELVHALTEVPALMTHVLKLDEKIQRVSSYLAEAQDVLYLGRGLSYPIALEGALKLKELSYIHAEGYAAGEMKHGPIALIDDKTPIVVVAPEGPLLEKTVSNIQEVIARGAQVLVLGDHKSIPKFGPKIMDSVSLPSVHPFVAPFIYSLPVQMLAYHTAVLKGTDVDQPRNLAKSVTVE